MITSISAEKTENEVSIWHLKKPYMQQYILKGESGQGIQDFEWIQPGKKMICA